MTLSTLDGRIFFPTTCSVSRHATWTGQASRPTHQNQQRSRAQGPLVVAASHRQGTPTATTTCARFPGSAFREAEETPGLTSVAFLHTRIPASRSRVQILPGPGLRNTSTNSTSTSLLPPPQKHDIVTLIQSRSSLEPHDNPSAARTSPQWLSRFRTAGVLIADNSAEFETGLFNTLFASTSSAPPHCTCGLTRTRRRLTCRM